MPTRQPSCLSITAQCLPPSSLFANEILHHRLYTATEVWPGRYSTNVLPPCCVSPSRLRCSSQPWGWLVGCRCHLHACPCSCPSAASIFNGIILSECACMKTGSPLIIFCLRCLLLLLVVAAPLCGTRLESFILAGAGIAAVSIDMGTEWIKVGIVKVGHGHPLTCVDKCAPSVEVQVRIFNCRLASCCN